MEEDVIVVRNQGTRSHVEWIWGIEVPRLPLFSLAFTEFWSGNYSFHTIWHKETTGCEERATMVVDQRTRQIVDFEVASTIYYPARPGQSHMWHLYAPQVSCPNWRFVSCFLGCNPGALEGSKLH
jgi:hypothetical protein